jgi:hypothetical protein
MFLLPPNAGGRGSDLAARGFDLLHSWNRYPDGKVLLVEGREELTERPGVVVVLIQLELLHEPRLLVKGTRRWLKRGVREALHTNTTR